MEFNYFREYCNNGKSPLVFIVADSRSRRLNISFNLFSDAIKQRFHITHISFNAIATTLMQKAMKRFCSLVLQMDDAIYKTPSAEVVDSIVVSAQGDIRNALMNFHFSSLKGEFQKIFPIVLKKIFLKILKEPPIC